MARARGLVGSVLLGAALLAPWLAAARPGILARAAAAETAAGQPGVESQVLSMLNSERVRAGLPLLTVDASMAALARNHSQDMAFEDRIFHDLQETGLLGRCSLVGENVGRAVSGNVVHEAFMASAVHRSDILGPYDRVGVGVVAGQTMLYVTEIFCQASTSPAQPSPIPPQPPVPTPKVVRPRPARPSTVPTPAPSPVARPPVETGGAGSPRQLI